MPPYNFYGLGNPYGMNPYMLGAPALGGVNPYMNPYAFDKIGVGTAQNASTVLLAPSYNPADVDKLSKMSTVPVPKTGADLVQPYTAPQIGSMSFPVPTPFGTFTGSGSTYLTPEDRAEVEKQVGSIGAGAGNDPSSTDFQGSYGVYDGSLGNVAGVTQNAEQVNKRAFGASQNPFMNMMGTFGGGNVPFQGTTPFYAQALGKSIGFNPQAYRDAGVGEDAVNQVTRWNRTRGIFGGLGTALSTAKDVMSGVASERRNQFVAMRNAQRSRDMQFGQFAGGSEDLFNNAYLQWYGMGYEMGGEVPEYAQGGMSKNDWISNKISKLHDEGYRGKQAVAIAYSMWDKRNKKYGGEIQDFQGGGMSHAPMGEASLEANSSSQRTNVPMETLLSGRVTTGAQPEEVVPINSNVEKGEYIIFPDGVVSKVDGKKHGRGGENMNLPEGTKIISDSVKIGGENAQRYRDMGLKVRARTTFAGVMDKWMKNSGLDDLHKEQEKYMKKLEKNAELEDGHTRGFNEQFLSENINRIEEEKMKLYKSQMDSALKFFDDQEGKKASEGVEANGGAVDGATDGADEMMGFRGDRVEFERGGEVVSVPLIFKDGGVYTTREHALNFRQWANKYKFGGMREATDAIKVMRDGGTIQKLDTGGKAGFYSVEPNEDEGTVTIIEKAGDDPQTLTPYQFVQKYKEDKWKEIVDAYDLSFDTSFDPSTVGKQSGRTFVDPVTGATVSGVTSGTVKDYDEVLSALNDSYKQFPDLVTRVFDPVIKDGKIVGVNKLTSDSVKEYQKGVRSSLVEMRELLKGSGASDEDIKAIDDYINSRTFLETIPAGASEADLARKIDGILGDFTRQQKNITRNVFTPEDMERLGELGISTLSQYQKAVEAGDFDPTTLSPVSTERLGKFGDLSKLKGEGFLLAEYAPEIEIDPVTPPEMPKFAPYQGGSRGQQPSPYTLINQDPLPPDTLFSHFTNTIDLPEATPFKVTPEPAIVEADRQRRLAMQQVQQNVGSQQGANLANMIAQTGRLDNQAVVQAMRTNAELAQQAQNINMQNAVTEARLQDMALERDDQLRAKGLDTHQQNIRNYFKTLQDNRALAMKDREQLIALQSMFDNFAYQQGQGAVFSGSTDTLGFGGKYNPVAMQAYLDMLNATSGNKTTATT